MTLKSVTVSFPESASTDLRESVDALLKAFCRQMASLDEAEQRSFVEMLSLQVASYDLVHVIRFIHQGASRHEEEIPMKFFHYLGRVNDLAFGALVTAAALGLLCVAGLALYAIVQMAPGDLFSLYA